MLKYLRIAVSALCLTACVLLVSLWVRSYQTIDIWTKVLWKNQALSIGSASGRLSVSWNYDPQAAWKWPDHVAWQRRTESPSDWQERVSFARLAFGGRAAESWRMPIYFRHIKDNRTYAFASYWVMVLITGILAAGLGIRRPYNFSLRTLLIATALVAAWMGTVVYLSG